MASKPSNPIESLWLLHNNAAGNARQCINLADALALKIPNLSVQHMSFRLKRPYLWLPPELTPRHTAIAEPDWSKGLNGKDASTFPDLLIACGRQSAPIAFSIKSQSLGKTRHIQILDPGSVRSEIDLLVVPEHDQVAGTDVLTTLGSLTPPVLARTEPRFADLPKPLFCALIGGSDRKHRFSSRECQLLIDQLEAVAKTGVGLAITASRRTDNLIVAMLTKLDAYPNVRFWHPAQEFRSLGGGRANGDVQAQNPYPAMLNEGQMFLVTPDSVNMVCEAARTGKGTMLLGKPKRLVAKKRNLHAALKARGYLRDFDPALSPWDTNPLDETNRVATEIITRFGATSALA